MRDFAEPTPGIPYLTEHSAQELDQISDRLNGEVMHHMRKAVTWENGAEPTVSLSLDEARMMIERLSRISHLLRLVSEGAL